MTEWIGHLARTTTDQNGASAATGGGVPLGATESGGPAHPRSRTPSLDTLGVAQAIKDRLGRRESAPVRVAFVGAHEDDRAPGEVPPLARLLRGGRGGEVRLKLELSFLWFAASPPHDLMYPARAWAILLGLEDPSGRGTRRVRQAINSLADAGLVLVEPHPGQPSRIYLLDETGSEEPYLLPGAAYSKARGSGREWRHRYIQLPDSLWTNGWLATLSGAALAMLLVLFVELGQDDPTTKDLWFSPSRAEKLYGLSEDTRSKGLRELRAADLVTARRRSASRDALDFKRVRNTYRLRLNRLDELAEVPIASEPPRPLTTSEAQLEDLVEGRKTTRPRGPRR